MFVVQTGRARSTRKYSIRDFCVVHHGVSGILTLHWDVLPKKK